MIETRPQPKTALLQPNEYYKLNEAISKAKGWEIGQGTERTFSMSPELAKVNIQYDSEGVETSYEEAYVMPISSDMQLNYPELLEGIELVSSYVKSDDAISEIIGTGLTEAIEVWFLHHFVKVGNVNGVETIWLDSEPITEDVTDLIQYLNDKDITVILPDNEEN